MKIEASLIKRLLRINSQTFVNSVLELSLSLFSPSHTLGHLEFLEHSWRSVACLEFWRNKEKEEQESASGHQDQQLQQVVLASIVLHVCFPH